MKQTIITEKRPMTLMFDVQAAPGTIIGFDVAHPTMPTTLYSSTDGEITSKNTHRFFTRMPLTPQKAILEIYNAKYPAGHRKRYSGFEVIGKKEIPLLVNLGVFDYNDEDMQEFIPFAEKIAERAAILSAGPHTGEMEGGSIYKSPSGRFVIQYLDEIIDFQRRIYDSQGKDLGPNPNYLKPASTSMRCNSRTGLIQIGRKFMLQYSIPERIAVMLHEFSHFYRNRRQDDEREADYHAAVIYSGLGYSKREFYTALWKVFKRNPFDLNVDRLNLIRENLDDLDKYTFSLGQAA